GWRRSDRRRRLRRHGGRLFRRRRKRDAEHDRRLVLVTRGDIELSQQLLWRAARGGEHETGARQTQQAGLAAVFEQRTVKLHKLAAGFGALALEQFLYGAD